MNHSGEPLPSVETLTCPQCQQTGSLQLIPATPTSRAIYHCLQCHAYIEQDALKPPKSQVAVPDPQTMYAHMLQMSSKLDTVLADAAMLRNEVSNLQKVVEENVTLRQHLTEKEKEIEELKKRLDTIQTQKQPQNKQQPQNSYNTGVNQPVQPNNPNRTTIATPAPHSAAVPSTYAEASRRFRPNQVRSVKRMAASIRAFQAPTGPQGYEYMYLPSRNRSTRQSTRQKLRNLGIETNRVLDIHYPARGVVALLLHVQYHEELSTKFKELDIQPLTFNPLDPANLHDPDLIDQSELAKTLAMQGIHNDRMLRALEHIGSPRSYSVGRSFIEKGWITAEELTKLTRKEAARAFRPVDDDMEETEDINL